jgi:hypothetical protein
MSCSSRLPPTDSITLRFFAVRAGRDVVHIQLAAILLSEG